MLQEIMNNPKAGYLIGTTTTAVGSSTWFGWLPDDIGKVATLVGIILSVVLIINHIRKGFFEHRKERLELRSLEADVRKKEQQVKARQEIGLPTRRNDDLITHSKNPKIE